MDKELEVQFMTFCDLAMVSQENKLSIIGIFDEIKVEGFPGGLTTAALVAIIKGRPDTTYDLIVEGGLHGKNVFPPIDINPHTGSSGADNITINLSNMGFPKAGDYTFTISHKGKEIGSCILHVSKANTKKKEKIRSIN